VTRATIIALVLSIAVAAVLRLGFTGLVIGFGADLRGDETDYHALGESIAAGRGFTVDDQPTGRRPPVYPFLLGVLYFISGPSAVAARLLQIVLGLIVVYLVFRVTRAYSGSRCALFAAGIAAVNPFLIFMSGYVLTENLYMILVLGALLLVPTPGDINGSIRRVLLASALMGLAALTRPTGLPLAIWMVCAALLFGGGAARVRLRNAAAAVVVVATVLLPWCIRNAERFGGWAGVTTHGGITFYQGNNPQVVAVPHYRGGVAPLEALPQADKIAAMTELERDRFTWAMGKEFLRQHKRDVPRLLWWKWQRFWRLRSDMGLSGVKSGWWWNKNRVLGRLASSFDVGFVYAVIAFPLFLAGIVLTARRWRELLFLYGVVVAHTAVALVFHGSIRGRIPVEPVIALFAAVTVDRLTRRRKAESQPSAVPPA